MGELEDFYAVLRECERREALRSFWYFCRVVHGSVFFNAGHDLMDHHHEELCNQLQGLWESRTARTKSQIYIEWCRGSLKSTVATDAFPMWVALNNPDIRIALDSQTQEYASEFLSSQKSKFESPYFQHLFGRVYNPRFRWSLEELTLNRTGSFKEPTIMASGLDATKTGRHFDLIIADDLIGETNSDNPEQIEKAKRRFGQYGSLLNKHGMLVAVGTVWGPDDIGAHIEEMNRKAEKRLLPKPFVISRYRDYIKGDRANGVEFPTLLPQDKLDAELLGQGDRLYACNYALERRNDKTATFMYDRVRFHEKKQGEFPTHNTYITIDPRKEGKGDDSDFAVITVGLVDEKYNLYVLEQIRERFTDKQTIDKVIELNTKYSPTAVGFEAVFEQITAFKELEYQAMERGVSLPLRKLKTSGKNKEMRIRALSPLVESGRLYIKEDMYDLKWELFNFKGVKSLKHDDCLDCLAYMMEFLQQAAPEEKKYFYDDPDWLRKWDVVEKGPAPNPNDVASMRISRDMEKRRIRQTRGMKSLRGRQW